MKRIILLALLVQVFVFPQVKHPEWSYDKSIYEVNVRQYTPEGTFKAFAKELPRLKEMGVGILWLMPINPIGQINRKGSLGSYYSVQDYLKVNPEFGTEEDFRNLIKEVHKHGMYIIIDWVANHTAWDNPMLKEHPEWYTKDSLGNFVAPVADWHDVVDLNYDNKELWKYMTGALEYWVKNFDIDGYRCDVAGMVPTEFWVEARKALDKIKPVFMLAEDEKPEIHTAFDMTYSWELFKIAMDIAAGKKDVLDIYNHFNNVENKYPQNAFRMRFVTNHDENTWNGTEYERLKDAVKCFNVFNAVVPGMMMMYNGQESALAKRLEFFERDPINWGNYSEKAFFTSLLKLKKENKALWNGEKGGSFTPLSTGADKEVMAFIRESGKNKVIAVFNMSPNKTAVNIENKNVAGSYTELSTGNKVQFNGQFEMEPWSYKVYYTK